jgi:hypothetical protein
MYSLPLPAFSGKTALGYPIPIDFFANCIGNRDCLFHEESEERAADGHALYGDCCHWRPQLSKETRSHHTRVGNIDMEEVTDFAYRSKKRKRSVVSPVVPIQKAGIQKKVHLKKHCSSDSYLDDEHTDVVSNFVKLTYTCPSSRKPRSPLYWVLKWVRGIDKPSKRYGKSHCLCKCKEKMYSFTCINPWHYR